MIASTDSLSLLGQSTDWLKDSDGVSLSEYRREVVDRAGSCWRHPADDGRMEKFRQALTVLFQGLFFNKVYPDDLFFVHEAGTDPWNFLPFEKRLLNDARKLTDICVVNKLGIGELHILYLATCMNRRIFMGKEDEECRILLTEVSNWVFLKSPQHRARNMGDFSVDIQRKVASLELLRVVKRLEGLAKDPLPKLDVVERVGIIGRLAAQGVEGAATCAVKANRLPYLALEFAGGLEQWAQAKAAGRAARDSRPPEKLGGGLIKALGLLARESDLHIALRLGLADLALTALARAIPRLEPSAGKKIYVKLRSPVGEMPRVRHKQLFDALPNDVERLALLNFLYQSGKNNPIYFVERFGPFFTTGRLFFQSRETGFVLKT
ncbi:MAG TPA: hypothetical protein P5195_09240 [Anaerolineae bacterium]|nr:hypothetical protein [Anaerolineae bacterium]